MEATSGPGSSNAEAANPSGSHDMATDKLDVARLLVEAEMRSQIDSSVVGPPSTTHRASDLNRTAMRLDKASRRMTTRSGHLRNKGGGSRV
ncbi:unnamed protein product, partial [Dovyalis caffra]